MPGCTATDLGVAAGLMSPRANVLALDSSDPLVLEALAAAEASYAPQDARAQPARPDAAPQAVP
jgi:hypothetical protein